MFDIFIDRKQLDAELDRLTRAHLKVAHESIDETTREYEKKLEAATKANSSGKLWRAWASDIRPKKGKIAREPAGFIYLNARTRTRKAIEFLTTSGRVQSKDGGYLAIPLPAAGSRGRLRDLTPGEWERATGIRLRFVYRRDKPALLVADMGTTNKRTGAFRPITRKRTAADERRGYMLGAQTVPIFILIAPYSFTARFSIATVMAPAGRRMAERFREKAGRIT